MNNVIISSLTLFLVFVTFTPGSVSSVRILIKKMEMEGWVLKSANISCLAEDIGHHVKQIVSIQLSGPGNVAIASLDYNSTVTLDEDLYFSKIEAEGNIQKETWKSYLTIVMTDILSSQSGTYTCEIHYFNREGFLRDDITSDILDAGEQDVSQVLLYLSSRISTLEDRNADRLQLESLKDLKETVKTHSQVNKDLQEKDRHHEESLKDLLETVKGLQEKVKLQEQDIKSQNQIIEEIKEANKTQSLVNKDLQEKDRHHEESWKDLLETVKGLQEKDRHHEESWKDLLETVKGLQEKVKLQEQAINSQNQMIKEANKTQSLVNKDLQEKDRHHEESWKDLLETVKGLQEKVKLQEQAINSQNQMIEEANKTQSLVNKDLQEKDGHHEESWKDLVETVKGLQEKVKLQEQDIKSQNQIIEEIKEANKTQSFVNKDLKEKGQVIAFTARYNSDDKIKSGDKLLFRHADLNLGNGYNPTTGVFTAPQSGLYSFTLTVATDNTGDEVGVGIKAKGGEVGNVYACDDDAYGDQSSISVTVRLSKGDLLYPYIAGTNTDTLEDSNYSVFTGYLVHGM